jgi:hypothetical protein
VISISFVAISKWFVGSSSTRKFGGSAIGSKKVAAVGRRDIEAIYTRLQDRPYQANRVLVLTSTMFNLALQWQWRSDNPVKGIKRYDEEKRDRWLSDDELRRLCRVLRTSGRAMRCDFNHSRVRASGRF